MFRIRSEQIKKIRTLLATGGRKLLFYHQDADGVCSAALMLKAFPTLEPYVREGPHLDVEFIKFIVQKQPDLAIFLDIPVDESVEHYRKIEQGLPGTKFLIIDHHIPTTDLNSSQTSHFNPMFEQKVYLPTSWLVYHILTGLKRPVKSAMWISAIGIVGDYAFKECADFLKRCKQSWPKADFESGAQLISAAVTIKGAKGAKYALSVLTGSIRPEDFLENAQLLTWRTAMLAEIDRILADFERKKELIPELRLIFYELKSKYNITSVVSSVIARANPQMLVVIGKETEDGWKISVRAPEGMNAAAIVKAAIAGIGIGGGHRRAAGGVVRDWKEFRNRITEQLRSE